MLDRGGSFGGDELVMVETREERPGEGRRAILAQGSLVLGGVRAHGDDDEQFGSAFRGRQHDEYSRCWFFGSGGWSPPAHSGGSFGQHWWEPGRWSRWSSFPAEEGLDHPEGPGDPGHLVGQTWLAPAV